MIAAIRDPKKMPSTEGKGEVVVIKYDAGEKEDAKKVSPRCYRTSNVRMRKGADVQVVAELKEQGINKIDVVIANAAVNLGCGDSFKDIDVDLQDETHRINVSRIYSVLCG